MDSTSFLAQASSKIGAMGSAFYFHPDTLAVGKANGLDGFRFYVLGRGGVLGDVESAVVSSAFGWWNPDSIDKIWNSARAVMAPRDAGRLYMKCAQDLGRAKFGALPGLEDFCASAAKISAAIDNSGLSLYAGTAAEPLAEDLPARAMQYLVALREYRGSAHLVAVLAHGLSPRVAHLIRRPDMYKSFGWPEPAPEVSDAERLALGAADEATDRMVAPTYGVLSTDEASAFLATLQAMEAALAA